MSAENPLVPVRVEETIIGLVAGAAVGLAATSPLTLGLAHMNPLAAGIGTWATLQAGALWAGGLAGAAFGGWWMARQERDSHLSGNRYYPNVAEATRVMQKQQRLMFSAAQRAGKVRGIVLGGVEFAREQEVQHQSDAGITSSGKSTLIRCELNQGLERGDRAIIFDPSRDFTIKYYDPKDSVLMGGWDERAALWDAAVDLSEPSIVKEFATSVCGTEKELTGQNSNFHETAAQVLAGLILALEKQKGGAWTWRDLARATTLPVMQLAELAKLGNDTVESMLPSLATGKISHDDGIALKLLASKTDWIRGYASTDAPGRPRFSIQKWLKGEAHQDVRKVILNFNTSYERQAQAIFGAILRSATATINGDLPSVSPDAPNALWLFIDEARQIGAHALNELQKVAEMARKKGVRLVLALQTETQLAAAMGHEAAAPVLETQGMKLYTRLSGPGAEAVVKSAGMREVSRLSTTSENGATMGKVKTVVQVPVLTSGALTSLCVHKNDNPKGVDFICWTGDTLARLFQPFPPEMPDIAEGFVPSEAWRRQVPPEDPDAQPSTSADSDIEQADAGDAPPPAGGAPDPGRPDDDKPREWL